MRPYNKIIKTPQKSRLFYHLFKFIDPKMHYLTHYLLFIAFIRSPIASKRDKKLLIYLGHAFQVNFNILR